MLFTNLAQSNITNFLIKLFGSLLTPIISLIITGRLKKPKLIVSEAGNHKKIKMKMLYILFACKINLTNCPY
jgi:hypothetical protein